MPSLVCFERVSPNTHHKFFYCFMFLTEFRSCLLSCCAWSVNRPAAHLKLKQSVVCAFYLITMCVSPRNVYNTNCISAFLYSLVSLDPSGALSLSLCVSACWCSLLHIHSRSHCSTCARLAHSNDVQGTHIAPDPLQCNPMPRVDCIQHTRHRPVCERYTEQKFVRWRPFGLACMPLRRLRVGK